MLYFDMHSLQHIRYEVSNDIIVIYFVRDGFSESEPHCSSSSSTFSDIISFTCSLVYSGNWSPAARWQQFTETNELLGDPVTMTTDFDNFVHNK